MFSIWVPKFFRRSLQMEYVFWCVRQYCLWLPYTKNTIHDWLLSRWIIDITNNTPYLSLQKRIRPLWMNAERAVCDWQLRKQSLRMVGFHGKHLLFPISIFWLNKQWWIDFKRLTILRIIDLAFRSVLIWLYKKQDVFKCSHRRARPHSRTRSCLQHTQCSMAFIHSFDVWICLLLLLQNFHSWNRTNQFRIL